LAKRKGAYKSEKRKKELMRQKKQEMKRQKRVHKDGTPEGDAEPTSQEGEEGSGEQEAGEQEGDSAE
jgi:hypothetical protein